MSTPTPRQDDAEKAQPHRARELAESFGEDARRYDRTRPSYPAALIQRVVAACPGTKVLDVGMGTGIVAQLFQGAGCSVTGVEVDPRMAKYAEALGFEVEVSSFEDWVPAGRTFDAVVAGQSWHWIDPLRGAAKSAEVLHPGGQLAVFWNVFALDRSLGNVFADVYDQVSPGLPFNPWRMAAMSPYEAILGKTEDGILAAKAFGSPERWRYDWARDYSKEQWLDQVPTHGGHALIAPGKLAALLEGLGSAIDDAGGSFTMDYTAVAVSAERL